MASIGEIMAYFQAMEGDNVENIAPLVEEAPLRNSLVAWKSVAVSWKDAGAQCNVTDDVARWTWLWEQVDYDQTNFGIVAGLRTQDIGAIVQRLIGLRLIYPDGSINKMARQFLQSQIMAKMSGKRKPGRPPKEPAEKK